MAARSDAGDAGLEKKVLKKAKAAETSADAILKIVTKNEATKEPAAAAQFLGGLFAAGKLGADHADAMEALSQLYQHQGAPLELLDPELVAGLLARAPFYSRGLDALALLAYPRGPSRLDGARASASDVGRLVLDAVRARLGLAVDPEVAPALLRHFVERGGVHLPTADGRIRYAGAEEVRRVVEGIASAAAWSAAYAEHFSRPGSHGLSPEVLRAFDEPSLVRVLLAAQWLNNAELLAAFLALTPRAAPLWAALDGLTDAVHQNPFHGATYFTRSALACLAALASQREGAAVPATFEGHVQRTVHGYPMNIAGLDALAGFLLAAFRALGPARAAAFVALAAARDEQRRGSSLSAANSIEATLAALAAEDAAVRARVGAPSGVPPSIAALWTA